MTPPNPFGKPLILGHRGAPREAAENTLRSLGLALRRGADGVELDVQRSRDGVPVVIHDDTLERTMGVAGAVSGLAWPAIERLSGARVPSFAQAAAWAAASGAWLNVEIKAAGVEEKVVRILSTTGLLPRTVVSSFDAAVVARIGEIEASVPRFLLTERWDDAARAGVERSGAQGVCLRVDAADDATLTDIFRHGLPVVAWTVNEAATVERLLRAGVAAVISDDPGMAAGVRARPG